MLHFLLYFGKTVRPLEQWAAETHNLSKLYYQRKRTRAANACPLLFTAKITNHKQKIIHFDTKAQNVRKCATIGIFLLFFIGLAMFCKIPVGYSTPALFMPIIIFGYIYGGIFTATEAGASVVLYGIVFYFVKRFMNKNNVDAGFLKMTVDAAIGIAAGCNLRVAKDVPIEARLCKSRKSPLFRGSSGRSTPKEFRPLSRSAFRFPGAYLR